MKRFHKFASLMVYLLFVGITLFAEAQAQDTAQKIYRIQVFASKDKARAEQYADVLRSQGYSPVVVAPGTKVYKVRVGEFPTYADALFTKNQYRAGAFRDAYIASESLTTGTLCRPQREQTLKVEKVFKNPPVPAPELCVQEALKSNTAKFVRPVITEALRNADNSTLSEQDLLQKARSFSDVADYDKTISAYETFMRRFPASTEIPSARLYLAYWKLKKAENDGAAGAVLRSTAVQGFEEVIAKHPSAVEAGEAALRLAYIKVKDKDTTAAVNLLQKIAKDEVRALDKVRFEATYRLAKLYHAKNKRVAALQTFRELAEIADQTAFDANLHCEIAGLYMELARNGVVTLEDCRKECHRVLDLSAPSEKGLRAVAELMNLETYFYESNFNRCIQLASSFEQKYPDQWRELGTVLFWKGVALRSLGKRNESHDVFKKIRLTIPDNAEMFPTINFKAEALYDLALWYNEQGDELNENNTYQELVKKYPDSNTAKNVRGLLELKKK
jgi:TolA-binding protein